MQQDNLAHKLDNIIRQIVDDWFDSVKEGYVTEEEKRDLGIEPEIKRFHGSGNHRIKFARQKELDVTYGLAAVEKDGGLYIESSVNNKSQGFDYDSFVRRLTEHYWRSRSEKPWFEPGFDNLAYEDLLEFEPVLGRSVHLEARKEKADVIRLYFGVREKCAARLPEREDLIADLIDNYCLRPLRRIYAESYRER